MGTRKLKYLPIAMLGVFGGIVGTKVIAAQNVIAGQEAVSQQGPITLHTVASRQTQKGTMIDFVNAQPMDLPSVPSRSDTEVREDVINALAAQPFLGAPGFSKGGLGDGKTSPVTLGVPNVSAANSGDVTPQEYGTKNHPFSTARADLSGLPTNTSYPYRASGKLFFNIGADTFVCSASLIKPGIVVTAAHCVAEFGKSQFYSNWQFIPGYRNGIAPYGVWTVKQARILTAYYNGTDPCATAGVVCQDDVAVLVLKQQLDANGNPYYAGNQTGWYGYGWNGYGFVSGLTQISQIGYPNCLDSGKLMERNDSYGYMSASFSNNTIIGSLMCGGSSGGPWLVNLGRRPALTGTTAGSAADPNIVVGVTSWGYISTNPKEQGASPFLDTNIKLLVDGACAAFPTRC